MHKHELMKMTLTLESLVSQCDLCFADHVVPGWRLEWGTENLFLKEEEVGNIQGGSEIPQDTLNAILGHKYH